MCYLLNKNLSCFDFHLQTGIEMKGFEPIIESVFGPEGFFPEVNLQTMFETIDEKILSKVREFAEAQLGNWVTPSSEPDNDVYNKQSKYGKKMKRQSFGEPQV